MMANANKRSGDRRNEQRKQGDDTRKTKRNFQDTQNPKWQTIRRNITRHNRKV